MWQTFTPNYSNITAVEIYILTVNPGQFDDTLTVEITKDGEILASVERLVEYGFEGLLRFEFAQAVSVVPEELYELKVRDTGLTRFGWKFALDTYDRGSRYVSASERSYTDWFFRTYSMEPRIIYVDDDAAGANDGSSWENAYVYLQDALTDANSTEKPVEIRVAQGIYRPDQGTNQTPGDQEATFQLINGVALKGGYAGSGETDPNARDMDLYETILSGDLDKNDANENDLYGLSSEPNRTENSFHIVIGSGTDDSAILDGFTIIAGNARYPSPDSRGGGMYNYSGNPTIINCTFISNSAGNSGGGMYNGGGSNPTLTNCKFIRNWSIGGAGIYNLNSSPKFIDCTYSENSNVGDYIIEIQHLRGGTIFNENSDPNLINCSFKANQSSGMWNQASNPTLTNCVFRTNDGTGMLNRLSSPILTGCIFSGNFAQRGGGMCNSMHSEPKIANSIFSGNTAVSEGVGFTTLKIAGQYLRTVPLTGTRRIPAVVFSANSLSPF